MTSPLRCPSSECPSASGAPPRAFVRKGTFCRARDVRVARFRCRACGRGFSEQTLRADYRQKMPELGELVAALTAAGRGTRVIAQLLGVNRKTVVRRRQFAAARHGDFTAGSSPAAAAAQEGAT